MKTLKLTKKMIDELKSTGFVCSNGEILHGRSAVTKYEYTYLYESPIDATIGYGKAKIAKIVQKYGDLTVSEFEQTVSFSS